MATRLASNALSRCIARRSLPFIRRLLQQTHGPQASLPSGSSLVPSLPTPSLVHPPSRFLNTDASARLYENALEFLQYLHGAEIEGLGSHGDETLRTVKTYLGATLTESVNRVRQAMSTDDSSTGTPKRVDDVSLEWTVLDVISPAFFAANSWRDVEGGMSGWPSRLCSKWFTEFQYQQVAPVREIIARPSMTEQLSNDSAARTSESDDLLLLNKKFRLADIVGQLIETAPGSDKENGSLTDLVEQFTAAMLRFLEMQGGLTTALSNEEEVRMKTPRFEGWEDAWGSQYRGDALKNLENKLLSLSMTAPRNDSSRGFRSMSRLIPIVQGSGAGKSRLADMYASTHFAVSLVLQNGNSFPPRDRYVSEYFHDPLSREFTRFLDKERLEGLETYGSITRERTSLSPRTYTKASDRQNPTHNSVPYPWVRVARLRVAYFLAALFKVLNEMLAHPEYQTLSAWHHLFGQLATTDGVSVERSQFWETVIERANQLMYAGEDLQGKWRGHRDFEEVTKPTNLTIAQTLKSIISPPLVQFLTGKHARTLQQDARQDYPFVLIIDEAAYLHYSNYLRAFMWVLDKVVVGIIDETHLDNIFFLMLGTHSQISHFAPDEHFPSERVFAGNQLLPSVFLNCTWDSSYELPTERSLSASNTFRHLAQFGRPMWLSYIQGLERKEERLGLVPNERQIRRDCIEYALMKLRPLEGIEQSEAEAKRSAFAVLALRIRLDLDLCHPKRASELVASKMRWLINVSDMRHRIRTTYPSEPILVEAAACLMNGYGWQKNRMNQFPKALDDSPVTYLLQCLGEELNQSHVDRGANGELTARLLCVLAKDRAIRHKLGHHDYNCTMQYYQENNKALLFHELVPVKDFLKSLFAQHVYNELADMFKESANWAALDHAYVNFSHFSLVGGSDDATIYSKIGLFAMWNRHVAMMCEEYFRHIDLVIPMRYRRPFDEESMSLMLISIKNRNNDNKSKHISKRNVEGIPRVKNKTVHYLGLKRLPFLYHKGNGWIEPSETKPFLAVILSIGETNRSKNLVVREKPTATNKERVVFAVHGFLDAYRFPSCLSRTALCDIVTRHDVSGRFPESRPINEIERELFDQAHRIDGDFDAFADHTAKLLKKSMPPTTPKKETKKRSSKASVDG